MYFNQLEDVSEKGTSYIWAWFFGGDHCAFISDSLKQTNSFRLNNAKHHNYFFFPVVLEIEPSGRMHDGQAFFDPEACLASQDKQKNHLW